MWILLYVITLKAIKNMLEAVNSNILHPSRKKFYLKQSLTCRNYGNYVAKCKFCKIQYEGQTKNKYSTRWNNHRSSWNKFYINNDSDRAAHLEHFYKFYFDVLNAKPDITDCLLVIFVKQLDKTSLHWCENKTTNYLNAKININKFFYLIIVIEF